MIPNVFLDARRQFEAPPTARPFALIYPRGAMTLCASPQSQVGRESRAGFGIP